MLQLIFNTCLRKYYFFPSSNLYLSLDIIELFIIIFVNITRIILQQVRKANACSAGHKITQLCMKKKKAIYMRME